MLINDYTIPLAMLTSGILCLSASFIYILVNLRTHTIKMSNLSANLIGCFIGLGFIFWGYGSIQKVDEQLERSKLVLEVQFIEDNTRSDYITVKTTKGTFKIDNRSDVTITPGSKITVIKHKIRPYYVNL